MLALKTPSSILELLVRRGGLGTIPKGRSIAHNIFDNLNAVFLSFLSGKCRLLDDNPHESILPENFLLGVGQGNPRSVCCGVFSYQKWHWTKTVEQYLDHHSGRHDFQIDLALFVMNYETVFSGMANQMKDRTLCDKTISSHAIATIFCFFWMESLQVLRIHRRRKQK